MAFPVCTRVNDDHASGQSFTGSFSSPTSGACELLVMKTAMKNGALMAGSGSFKMGEKEREKKNLSNGGERPRGLMDH